MRCACYAPTLAAAPLQRCARGPWQHCASEGGVKLVESPRQRQCKESSAASLPWHGMAVGAQQRPSPHKAAEAQPPAPLAQPSAPSGCRGCWLCSCRCQERSRTAAAQLVNQNGVRANASCRRRHSDRTRSMPKRRGCYKVQGSKRE